MTHQKRVDSKPVVIQKVLGPFHEFLQRQTSGGIILLICAVSALVWANSPWSGSYHDLWETHIGFAWGDYSISESLLHWINDGLMAAFFFVVGLEIKREILVGELASFRKASLPLAAAAGGMIVPAIIFAGFNLRSDTLRGWGIPMATDIAFALGILALMGNRTPLSAKIFLTALAIADDIGATLVIALFYTSDISGLSLAVGFTFFAMMLVSNFVGIRSPLFFFALGLGLWLAFLKSGVHPTISGVLGAMTIPSRMRIDSLEFLNRGRRYLDEFDAAGEEGSDVLANSEQQSAILALESACEKVQTPLQILEHRMHPWVSFGVMPIFALANAGVEINGSIADALSNRLALGIIGGLVLGKQIGITLFSWLAVRSGLAQLPDDLTWRHIYGLSWLGGIGFTMSLFISTLAFGGEGALDNAKIAILTASILAVVGGTFVLLLSPRPKEM